MTIPAQDPNGFQDMNELTDALLYGGSPKQGIFSAKRRVRLAAANALVNQTAAQAIFPAANDAFAVDAASVYAIDGVLRINNGTSSHTIALGFALTTTTLAHFAYVAIASGGAADDTTATALNITNVDTNASTVVTAAITTAETVIWFRGEFETTLGGIITPQIAFSAQPGGTNELDRGSFIEIQKLGKAGTLAFGPGWS